ncbi:MAG: hypothetical protein BGO92_16870 [Magnetospirillum sp. 64-120]|uniref:YajG family lipoprotein n=1 Tax=Magnetospirillum sp. 64-120 TaxID=1895778 RepID=UPI00092A7D8A|nr:YajG family lipoprotein [Magnetospirillum sp. 64-120]OJX78819.1 MAG: hypothetical protein BGO92_16870 [Magnetospirillum sp. 64-120]
MMLRIVAALLCAASLSACALTVDEVDLNYKQMANSAAIGGANQVQVKVQASDARTSNRDRISVKKNGYGMEMAAIVAKQDIPSLIGKAIESELSARGFKIAPGNVFVLVDVNKFYNDFKTGFMTGDAQGEVTISAQVLNAAGKTFYAKVYTGEHKAADIMIFNGSNAKEAVEGALANATAKMLSDQYFIQALIEAGRPATASLSGPAS